MKITISIAQMDIAFGAPEQNLAVAEAMAAEAARRGSDLLLLPELWSTGYDLANAAAHAAEAPGAGIFAEMARMARHHDIYLAGSCLSLLGPGQYGNTMVLYDQAGLSLGQYSKLHLFRLMDEDQFLTAGNEPKLLAAPWGQTGLAICYDLRFPELFRTYALAGARLILLPSEWPHPRMAHWQTLLRARAIENQLYIVACNRVGRAGDTTFFGHSCIINPWGETVIEGGEGELLLTATIDLERVDAIRAKIPVFADRRPDIY